MCEISDKQKERVEVVQEIWRDVLDPILTFAQLMRGYDEDGNLAITLQDIGAVLRLLVLGGLSESKLQCTEEAAGCLAYTYGEEWEGVMRQASEAIRTAAKIPEVPETN